MYEPRNSNFFADLAGKEQKRSAFKEVLSIKQDQSPKILETLGLPSETPHLTQSLMMQKYGKFLPSIDHKVLKQFDFRTVESHGAEDFYELVNEYKDKEATGVFKSCFSLDCWVKALCALEKESINYNCNEIEAVKLIKSFFAFNNLKLYKKWSICGEVIEVIELDTATSIKIKDIERTERQIIVRYDENKFILRVGMFFLARKTKLIQMEGDELIIVQASQCKIVE